MRDKIQQIREKALAEIDKADGLEKLMMCVLQFLERRVSSQLS